MAKQPDAWLLEGGNMRCAVIIDDHPDTIDILTIQLELLGFESVGACTGADGLRAISANRPDVAVIDLGLPDMSGLDVARTIRASGHRIRLVALTGRSEPRDRELAQQAGFEAFLVKPASVDALRNAITGSREH